MQMWSLTGIKPVHGDSLALLHFFTIVFGHGITSYVCNELPVFKPNDFFWEHHWDGKEDKWRLYARVMQQIIAEVGGYECSSSTLEDKLEYKNLIRGKRDKLKSAALKKDE